MKSKAIHKNKNLLLISGLMIIVAVVLVGLISYLFSIAKKNTINMWVNSVTETAVSVQTYVNTAEDAISFTGIQINEMLDSGSSQEEIKDFVLNQSGIYSAFIDGCYNGLYGYINGEYITSGRENYSEYDVITSKWYLAARQANGGTAFVSPYMNEHAHTMMMSVSRTLSDNSSVISMDLLLVDYQQLLDNLVEQNKAGFAAIIDKDGTVICHVNKEEIGKNYYMENNPIKEELMNKITTSQNNNYEMSYDGHKYIGFFDTCSNGWYVVMALDKNDVFYSLRRVYTIAISVLLLAVIALVTNMWLVITKQNEVDKLGEEITEEKKRGEDLKKISETDKMTGILNRGGGEARVREKMLSECDGMFCVMDADHFKSVNDNYGHAVGDKVIIAIARSMERTFRESDIYFRLGGDEFAVFLKGVSDENLGNLVFQRFFDDFGASDIPELMGKKICISVGVAFYNHLSPENFEDLYRRADKGTYESKQIEGNFVSYTY